MIGQAISHYRIIEKLGGGMGADWIGCEPHGFELGPKKKKGKTYIGGSGLPLMVFQVACGGSKGTPPGTYTITVASSTGSQVHTTPTDAYGAVRLKKARDRQCRFGSEASAGFAAALAAHGRIREAAVCVVQDSIAGGSPGSEEHRVTSTVG